MTRRKTSRRRTSRGLRRNSRSIHVGSTAGSYQMNRLSGQDYYALSDKMVRLVLRASGYEPKKDSNPEQSWRAARIDALAALMSEALLGGPTESMQEKRHAMDIAASVSDQHEGRT